MAAKLANSFKSISLSGKSVMVTGGSGFLGTHIVAAVKKRNPLKVIVPRSAEYNLVDKLQTEKLLKEQPADFIIHAAGSVGGIGANRHNPGKFIYENLMMGANILECSRHANVQKIVMIGTICSYPKFTPIPFKEEDLWNGYPEETNAPYGVAKKALLVQAQAYRQQYGLKSIYLMPVNMYGPHDNFSLDTSHIIPAVIRKCIEAVKAKRDEIVCWGDGSPTREFFYAEDAAEGIVLGLERYDGQDPVNLGTGREISIREVTEIIAKLTGFEGKVVWDTTQPNGQLRRCVDVSRAERYLGFKAATSLEDGLKKTIDWYLKTL